MAKIQPVNPPQRFALMFPYGSTRGSDLSLTTLPNTAVTGLQMPNTAIGVFNAGASAITLNVVMAEDDHLAPIAVTIQANTGWHDFAFNAVIDSGSTGHTASTTRYLTNWLV